MCLGEIFGLVIRRQSPYVLGVTGQDGTAMRDPYGGTSLSSEWRDTEEHGSGKKLSDHPSLSIFWWRRLRDYDTSIS